MDNEVEALLAEQLAYYRALAFGDRASARPLS
jgi:hypothetical protein